MSYAYDGDEKGEYGIYVAEGSTGDGSFLSGRPKGRADTALAVMCQCMGGENQDRIFRILQKFEHWFRYEFSHNVDPFSPEVVKCYWRRMIGGTDGAERRGQGLAALLIYRDQLVFCGVGGFAVYEYSFDQKKGRRWPIGRERRELDRELGIPEQETESITFLSRSISKEAIFLILPRQISFQYPNKISRNKQWQQFTGELARHVPCAVLCHIQYK